MRGFSKRSGEVHRVSQCEKIYTPQGINEHVGRFAVANIVTIYYLLIGEVRTIRNETTYPIHGKYPLNPKGTADIFRGIMVSLYVTGKDNGHV